MTKGSEELRERMVKIERFFERAYIPNTPERLTEWEEVKNICFPYIKTQIRQYAEVREQAARLSLADKIEQHFWPPINGKRLAKMRVYSGKEVVDIIDQLLEAERK